MAGKLKLLFVCVIFGFVSADNITGKFEEGSGWKLVYVWSPPVASKAESSPPVPVFENTTIWRNDVVIAEYKAATTKNVTQERLTVSCSMDDDTTGRRKCLISVNVTQSDSDDVYNATAFWDVAGTKKAVNCSAHFMVHATKAKIDESLKTQPKTLNCSSEGTPAPSLIWTKVEGKVAKEVKAASHDEIWNEATKKWKSWSVYSWQKNETFNMTCTPKQGTKMGEVKGISTTSHVNAAGKYDAPAVFAVALLSLALLSKNIV